MTELAPAEIQLCHTVGEDPINIAVKNTTEVTTVRQVGCCTQQIDIDTPAGKLLEHGSRGRQ